MKIALYARVSKALEQNPENQLLELRKWASNTEHEIVGEFVDECSSRDTRPKKEEVLRLLRLGEIDGVAFTTLDRWGRSMSELVLELEEFSQSHKAMISLKEGFRPFYCCRTPYGSCIGCSRRLRAGANPRKNPTRPRQGKGSR